MVSTAATTVHRPSEEVRRMREHVEYPHEYIDGIDAAVTFRDAPGDRGTEIHVHLCGAPHAALSLFELGSLALSDTTGRGN